MIRTCVLIAVCLATILPTPRGWSEEVAQGVRQTKGDFYDAFRQMDEEWPTASPERLASGAPGPGYWQQRANYQIHATLDEVNDTIRGEAVITYFNESPHELRYLWLHLDQNRFSKHSPAFRSRTTSDWSKTDFWDLDYLLAQNDFPGGMEITYVRNAAGEVLRHNVRGTQMRVDLPQPLSPHAQLTFSVAWTAKITPIRTIDGRAGVEQLEGAHRKVYTIAQWFPRMTAYTDVRGWHIHQFLGTGEFTLEFGDYDVELTVPADHIVSATGELQNPDEVLSSTQRDRWSDSETALAPVYLVTPDEAQANEQEMTRSQRTWHFKATNVRDFAFASSRSFIWQSWSVRVPGRDTPVRVMAYFPSECSPLWDQYAVHATAQAIQVYSQYSLPYPYPVINTVNYGSGGGMEFPMITFTAGRVDIDKETQERTYSRQLKQRVIGIIIHETGHQFFPMTVNSDERQWMWLDEGLNSFLESLAKREWESDWPQRADEIAAYMRGSDQVPVMTQADQLHQVGNNAYAKVTAALTVLREVVLGREQFDFAFREYARRWSFKRPMPADFFRSLEDASGTDLDWFWRGWFYSTDHVDLSVDDVRRIRIDSRDPDQERPWERRREQEQPKPSFEDRDGSVPYRVDQFPELKDFYNEHDEHTVTDKDRNEYDEKLKKLEAWQRKLLATKKTIYALQFTNRGGLVMPLPLRIEYGDGSTEDLTLDQTIWRRNPRQATHLLVRDKEIKSIQIDPRHDLYDSDYDNNHFPRRIQQERMKVEDDKEDKNLMKDMKEKRKKDAGE